MPYLPTAQSFLEQSTLLISARPTTTRITTKYTLPHPNPPQSIHKPNSSKPTAPQQPTGSSPQPMRQRQPPVPTLTFKTYDPVSGTCLKYQTDKAAEVGRLVASLGNCGRAMAALPAKEEVVEGMVMAEADGTEDGAKQAAKEGLMDGKVGQKGGGPAGGKGGKKKKGRR